MLAGRCSCASASTVPRSTSFAPPVTSATAVVATIWPDCSAISPAGSPTPPHDQDRKSTRLNSSHTVISYAVFCLKKKKKQQHHPKTKTNKQPTTTTHIFTATN